MAVPAATDLTIISSDLEELCQCHESSIEDSENLLQDALLKYQQCKEEA